MKTTTLLTVLTFLLVMNLNATEYKFAEEATINDITIDTKAIFDSIMEEHTLASVTFEEEGYVNDIPFNTEKISQLTQYQLAIAIDFEFAPEDYIDDIPFNTCEVSQRATQASAQARQYCCK